MTSGSNSQSKLMIINEDHLGLHLINGPPAVDAYQTLSAKTRAQIVSRDGNFIAFSDNTTTKVMDLNTRSYKFEEDIPGVLFMGLSPKNRFLQTWIHTKDPKDHNLLIYDIETGEKVQTMKQKQSQWKLHWTDDEAICVRFFNEELHFYNDNDFTRYVGKFFSQKVADFSLATNIKTGIHYFATLSLGTHGQPNFIRLYRYPQMDQSIAHKSFFRTDRATFKWRSRGDAVLILCAADVDKTGKSYYGEQNLNYMDVNGKAFAVKLDKDGPIHSVEWHPSTTEILFCVSYGFVPPRIALIDSDCRIVHSFGQMHINQIHFNPFGNLVIFAGFGNLRGGLSIYNAEKKVLISKLTSPDTTWINWAPDGVHLLTAVTSPRMRVGNCLRIWHYSGKLIKEFNYPDGDSLFRSIWRPNQSAFPTPPKITETGIDEAQLSKEAGPARYVPPHLRNSGSATSGTTISASSLSTSSSKAPKGKGGRGRGKGRGGGGGSGGDAQSRNSETNEGEEGGKSVIRGGDRSENTINSKERKIKTLEKKLDAIKKLKTIQSAGGQLEKNQLAKITKEKELIAELKNLQISESS